MVADPTRLLTTRETCFGDPLDEADPVWLSLIHSDIDFNTEAAQAIAEAMLGVVYRQLGPYVNDAFTSRERELAQACPTTNIGAERRVSMCDAQQKRAPNACMDFLEAKVKAATNGSPAWLSSLPQPKKEAIIQFACKRTRTVTLQKKKKSKETTAEIIQRIKAASQQKDEKARNALQKKVAALITKSDRPLGIEDLLVLIQDKEIEPCLNEETRELAVQLMNTPETVVGYQFNHVWHEEKANIEWTGNVTEFVRPRNKRSKPTFLITYTQPNGAEDDQSLSPQELLTDVLFGDLFVLSAM